MTGIFAAERRQEYSPGRKPGVNIASSKSPGGTTEPSLAEPLPSAPTANDSRLHPKALKEFRKISLAHKVRKMLEYTTVKTRGGLHAHHRRLDCKHASETPPVRTSSPMHQIASERSARKTAFPLPTLPLVPGAKQSQLFFPAPWPHAHSASSPAPTRQSLPTHANTC